MSVGKPRSGILVIYQPKPHTRTCQKKQQQRSSQSYPEQQSNQRIAAVRYIATQHCKKRQYSYIKVSVAPSRGTCDVRYNSFLKKQKDVWEGGKGKFKDTVITKRKSLAPQTFCRRRREGVSMPKKMEEGVKQMWVGIQCIHRET